MEEQKRTQRVTNYNLLYNPELGNPKPQMFTVAPREGVWLKKTSFMPSTFGKDSRSGIRAYFLTLLMNTGRKQTQQNHHEKGVKTSATVKQPRQATCWEIWLPNTAKLQNLIYKMIYFFLKLRHKVSYWYQKQYKTWYWSQNLSILSTLESTSSIHRRSSTSIKQWLMQTSGQNGTCVRCHADLHPSAWTKQQWLDHLKTSEPLQTFPLSEVIHFELLNMVSINESQCSWANH